MFATLSLPKSYERMGTRIKTIAPDIIAALFLLIAIVMPKVLAT
jgi:hypothetical protein